MQFEIFRKNSLKAIFSIFIVFIFLTEVAHSENQVLKRIQQYLVNMRTLQADFSQLNDTGDVMTGKLFLKKPGKIRFSYDQPHNLQIVSKQRAILIFDPKGSGSGPLTYPLSSTPLGFLIGNESVALVNEHSESFELDDNIFIKIQNPQYRLSIEFKKKPMSLVGWEFENQMGEIVSISLNNIKTNDYMSDEIFKTEKDYERFKK